MTTTRTSRALPWITLSCVCFWGAVMILVAVKLWGCSKPTPTPPAPQWVKPGQWKHSDGTITDLNGKPLSMLIPKRWQLVTGWKRTVEA